MNGLHGTGGHLRGMIATLIDDFIEEYPETPIQTIHVALMDLAKEYDPAEDAGDTSE